MIKRKGLIFLRNVLLLGGIFGDLAGGDSALKGDS